jgi:hypothetical protein
MSLQGQAAIAMLFTEVRNTHRNETVEPPTSVGAIWFPLQSLGKQD